MRNYNDSTPLTFLVSALVITVIVMSFALAIATKVNGEQPDHGATAWGYKQRIFVTNTDCKRDGDGYVCAVIPSTGPTRFVACVANKCEEMVPQ